MMNNNNHRSRPQKQVVLQPHKIDDIGIRNDETNTPNIPGMLDTLIVNFNSNNNISYGTTISTNEYDRKHNENDKKIADMCEVNGGENCSTSVTTNTATSAAIIHSRHKTRSSTLLRNSFIAIFCMYCFYCAVVGVRILRHKNRTRYVATNYDFHHVNDSKNNAIAALFNFDTLFRGIKKKTPASTLRSPPRTARSILLVLNAETKPENPSINDMDRQLTSKGMREAKGLGIYLKEHHIPEPDWIFTSPSKRTSHTTELIRKNWALKAPVAYEEILYTLEFNDYFAFVAGINVNYHRIMIVGHNPAILNTARKLMKTHGIEDFPQCGFMEIRWDNLDQWMTVTPFTGNAKMAVDPNNNFYYSSK